MESSVSSRRPTGILLAATLLAALGSAPASAQWRMWPDALVGIDQIPVLVNDLEAATQTWRDLGFTIKPGAPLANGIMHNQVKFEDGSGIELIAVPAAVDEQTTLYREMLDRAEGPAGLSFHARDMGLFRTMMQGSRYDFGVVSGTFERGFDYLRIVHDSRAPDDALYVRHPNGTFAMGRVWLALPSARALRDMLIDLGADATKAKVYAPDAVQADDLTISNGEVLILPRNRELTRDRPVVGVTFEIEDIDALRKRLDIFDIPWTAGGTENVSVIVSPEVMHGMWVEFRE